MISACAACQKPVYPTEKLNCLDRVWHKTCFKCQECNMTLNMKNYKGFEKKPYCAAHYPTVKYTQVAETPENKRLKQNTDSVSKAKYQADFQKQKGTKLSVANDAASEKLKQITALQSKAAYQKEFKEEIIGSKTSVAEDVSTAHLKQVQDQTSQAKYHKDFHDMKGQLISTTDDIKNDYLKDLQGLSQASYQKEFRESIVGTKTSVVDDATQSYLQDTQSKVTGIGYKQNINSRPNSLLSESSLVLETLASRGSVDSVEPEPESLSRCSTESITGGDLAPSRCSTAPADEVFPRDEEYTSPPTQDRVLSASPVVAVSVGKMKKIQKLSESINVFRTSLTPRSLNRLLSDEA